jgi:hypothetical protein
LHQIANICEIKILAEFLKLFKTKGNKKYALLKSWAVSATVLAEFTRVQADGFAMLKCFT